ncbi:MAG: transmembrane anchor protein [Candidatus Sericytochromatia bacterium]
MSNIPMQDELPSLKQLIHSSGIALAVATTLMVTVVLPAEFGRDPTGVGTLLGLTEMGRIKQSLAQEAAKGAQHREETVTANTPAAESSQPPANAVSERKDEMSVTLAPDQATEIKVTLDKDEKVNYTWNSTGQTTFDTHGDSKELNIDYHSYGKGAKIADEGMIVAKFTGNHGWYWRNRTTTPLTITLKTQGKYRDIKRME